VSYIAVGGAGQDGAVSFLKFRQLLLKGQKFFGADAGEVFGIKIKNNGLATDQTLELKVSHNTIPVKDGWSGEEGGLAANEYRHGMDSAV
jgi:hypothetical protein